MPINPKSARFSDNFKVMNFKKAWNTIVVHYSSRRSCGVTLYAPHTEDEYPQPPATPRTPNTAQQLIQGGPNLLLPPAADHSSVHHAQQQEHECQELRRLLGLPRSEWPPHLQPTPLRFCVVHDLFCLSIADAAPRPTSSFRLASTAALAPHTTSAIMAAISASPRLRLAWRPAIGGRTYGTTSAHTSEPAHAAWPTPPPSRSGGGSVYP
ncbi:hypothetical protein ACSSS7_003290 [Eimeria intestinalis]